MPRNDPRTPVRPESPRWAGWRGLREPGATALTSRRGLRVEVKRQDGGWAVRHGDHPDVAWAHCSDDELERTLRLTLGLDEPEAQALAAHVRGMR